VPPGGQRRITEADYAGIRFDDARLPENLLANAGFEDGLRGWYIESGQPQIDERIFAGGKQSLRFDGFAECVFTAVGRVEIDPRRAYQLSVKLKTDLKAGLSCLQLIAFKANGQGFGWWHTQDYTSEFCYGRGTQDWHTKSIVIRQFPPETEYVNVYLLLHDAIGVAWFDDVKLAPLSLAETREVVREGEK